MTVGSEAVLTIALLTETTTVLSGVLDQQTAIQIPVDSVVLAVCVRIVAQPGGTATMVVRGAYSGHQFNGVEVSTVAGSTEAGTAGCPVPSGQTEPIRMVFNAVSTDAAGRITVTIFYYMVTP